MPGGRIGVSDIVADDTLQGHTTYAIDRGAPDARFRLEVANMELPLLEAGAAVTEAADVPAGPR